MSYTACIGREIFFLKTNRWATIIINRFTFKRVLHRDGKYVFLKTWFTVLFFSVKSSVNQVTSRHSVRVVEAFLTAPSIYYDCLGRWGRERPPRWYMLWGKRWSTIYQFVHSGPPCILLQVNSMSKLSVDLAFSKKDPGWDPSLQC